MRPIFHLRVNERVFDPRSGELRSRGTSQERRLGPMVESRETRQSRDQNLSD